MSYKDKQKQREYQRNWMANRRAKHLMGKKCARCGCANNLEFHHKDKTIKESHRVWSWAVERREKELAKCVILCKLCHGKAHRTAKHGSSTKYDKHGCRCAACRLTHSKRGYAYRQRKKRKLEQQNKETLTIRMGRFLLTWLLMIPIPWYY